MKCSFKPYEGNEKYIFISYSHQSNSALIVPILERLNQEGFRIWYDDSIEWGSEWPEEVAFHLSNCEVCLAFLSNESVVSLNCRQEIYYALKKRKHILPIYLEEVDLSDGMDMSLTSFQSPFLFQCSNQESFFDRLTNTKVLQTCKNNLSMDESAGTSFDDQLTMKFKELFEECGEKEEPSFLARRMSVLKSKNFMEWLEGKLAESIETRDNEEEFPIDESLSLIPEKYSGDASRNGAIGKHFSIPDRSGFKTVVFQIKKKVDYNTLSSFYCCEPLDSFHTEAMDETFSQTQYYVDAPQEEGNQLAIIHINYEKGEVYVNMGYLGNDKLMISKTPAYMELKKPVSDTQLNLSPSAYNLDALTDEELYQVEKQSIAIKSKWMDANIDENLIIVVDPETALPVQRELVYDKDENKWKARILIEPGKSYFAFQIASGDMHLTRNALSNIEIAEYYKMGTHGFPQSVMQAGEYYEKDGTAASLYQIALLFRTDSSIYDYEVYCDYLQRASEMGCEDATIEMAINLLFSSDLREHKRGKDLLISIDEKKDVKNFVLGYFTEKKILDGDVMIAFDFYFEAYQHGYRPACARLGNKKSDVCKKAAFEAFTINAQQTEALADYCMGCLLLFGIGVIPYKSRGIELLTNAAHDGYRMAAEALKCFCQHDADTNNNAL